VYGSPRASAVSAGASEMTSLPEHDTQAYTSTLARAGDACIRRDSDRSSG